MKRIYCLDVERKENNDYYQKQKQGVKSSSKESFTAHKLHLHSLFSIGYDFHSFLVNIWGYTNGTFVWESLSSIYASFSTSY